MPTFLVSNGGRRDDRKGLLLFRGTPERRVGREREQITPLAGNKFLANRVYLGEDRYGSVNNP